MRPGVTSRTRKKQVCPCLTLCTAPTRSCVFVCVVPSKKKKKKKRLLCSAVYSCATLTNPTHPINTIRTQACQSKLLVTPEFLRGHVSQGCILPLGPAVILYNLLSCAVILMHAIRRHPFCHPLSSPLSSPVIHCHPRSPAAIFVISPTHHQHLPPQSATLPNTTRHHTTPHRCRSSATRSRRPLGRGHRLSPPPFRHPDPQRRWCGFTGLASTRATSTRALADTFQGSNLRSTSASRALGSSKHQVARRQQRASRHRSLSPW